MNKLAIGLYLASIFSTWYVTATYKDAIWQDRISTAHEQEAKVVAEQWKIALSYQKWINELNDKIEVENAKAQKSINDLRASNNTLASRVRTVPAQADTCPMPGDVQSAGSGDAATTASELFPVGTAKTLVEFAARADEVTEVARACQGWVRGAETR